MGYNKLLRADMLNLNSIINSTTALGPGKRYVIWTQGCNKKCNGCIMPEGIAIENNMLIRFDEIANKILRIEDIEGITISGGEPFLQSENLFKMAALLLEKSNLSIIIYSGYKLSELKNKKDEYVEKLLSVVDVLIDGEYNESLNDDRGLRGSTNQNIHFFTGRYKELEDDFKYKIREVDIRKDKIIGIKPKGFDNFMIDFIKKRKLNSFK